MLRLPSALAAFSLAVPALAAPLRVMHSGYMLRANDEPLSQAGVSLGFKLYEAQTPGAPAVWQSSACSVDVRQGYYAVELGGACNGTAALDDAHVPLGAPRFLEVSIDGVPLLPRLALSMTPTSASAARAADADRLGGLLPGAFAAAAHTHASSAVTDFAPSAVAAMGAKGATNPLHHDRYTDAEAVAAVAAGGVPWASISGEPAAFPPATHAHPASDVTGVLAIANGGTGSAQGPTAAGQFLRSSAAGTWAVGGIQAADVPGLAGKLDAAGGTLTGTLTLSPSAGHALVTTAGNVGLGTIAPEQRLQVSGGLRVGLGAAYQDVVLETDTSITGNGAFKARPRTIPGSGVSNQYFRVASEGNTTAGPGTRHHLVVDGNVGIGTTTPGTRLEVAGDAKVTGRIDGRLTGDQELRLVLAGACLAGVNATGGSFLTSTSTAGRTCAQACTAAHASASCAWGATYWVGGGYFGYTNECSAGVNYQQGSAGYHCCCRQGASASGSIVP